MTELILAIETHRGRGIGTFLRCGAAFGASAIIIVGSPKFGTHGAMGAQKYTQIMHYYTWGECLDYVREKGCDVVGISPHLVTSKVATKVSKCVDSLSFKSSVCFVIAEKDGLTQDMINFCDEVFHVSVPSMETLIKYDAKVAICLQKYCTDMGSSKLQCSFEEEKYFLGERPSKTLLKRCSKQQNRNNAAKTSGEPIIDTMADVLSSMFFEDEKEDGML